MNNTMKLRLQYLESKETLKIEVPNPCSFQQLKFTISQTIPSSSSSSSLHLSLNRKHEINATSPHDSLQLIGIAPGDLIFYTFNPNAFSRTTDEAAVIDLRDNVGLELPPSFMHLPKELKLMIFEYLPGVDLAKVCCTCSELQYLASNDELWKKKLEKEFRQTRVDPRPMKSFKNLFDHYRAEKIERIKRRKKLFVMLAKGDPKFYDRSII